MGESSSHVNVRMPGLRSGPGSQYIYSRDLEQLVVEWHDFGDDVPYESANKLVLNEDQQRQLAFILGAPEGISMLSLAERLAERFDSYFDVRAFLDENHLSYSHEVDFTP
jgi:hypothetical protein